MTKDLVQKSKLLSLVLRHRPELIGLKPDAQGWVEVDQLLKSLESFGKPMSKAELEQVVATNDKQRFAFSKDKTAIRANQGHSINIDLDYPVSQPPQVLYHGTAQQFLASILKNGIQKKSRHHVHLSAETEIAKIVGSRYGKPVLLKIQSGLMHEAGIKFYKSENEVWLTDFVDPQFISINKQME